MPPSIQAGEIAPEQEIVELNELVADFRLVWADPAESRERDTLSALSGLTSVNETDSSAISKL